MLPKEIISLIIQFSDLEQNKNILSSIPNIYLGNKEKVLKILLRINIPLHYQKHFSSILFNFKETLNINYIYNIIFFLRTNNIISDLKYINDYNIGKIISYPTNERLDELDSNFRSDFEYIYVFVSTKNPFIWVEQEVHWTNYREYREQKEYLKRIDEIYY